MKINHEQEKRVMQQIFILHVCTLLPNRTRVARRNEPRPRISSCVSHCKDVTGWWKKSKTQIHLDKHWLCPEYPGLFGPLPGLIISTYLSGRATHPSSPILQTFNAPHPEGYIKKELTNGHIQHQSEPRRCRPALPTRRSCLQLAERVRKLLLIFHRRRLDFVIRF